MTARELRHHCLALPGAVETFPFHPETSVFKVGGKIFALSRLAADPLQVSLKCEPLLGESLRDSYDAIVPGYHLNKKHWLTITLGLDAPDPMVRDLIEDSFDLVKPRTRRRRTG
jgi:predicted DNA-binding protein (MmcQ/YjbR family)